MREDQPTTPTDASWDHFRPPRRDHCKLPPPVFSQLARETGRHLAWERINPQRNIAAFRAAYRGDERPLRALISNVTAPLGRERGRALERRGRAARERGRSGR